MRESIQIGDVEVKPGQRRTINLPIARLYTHSEISIPVHVIHGRKEGPRLFVCAAVHGDEINGVEVIRRLLKLKILDRLHGTLIAIPIVNVYGFIHLSRYLPDRRDLNRFFPGTDTGSLTSRLGSLLMEEVVDKCTHGIDFHTGSNHRTNLPQIRACLDDPETERIARAFGASVIIDARLQDGSLREAVAEKGIPMLLYEGGEALRFNEIAIQTGLRGILAVMREIGLLKKVAPRKKPAESLIIHSTKWLRAPISGILYKGVRLGTKVSKDEVIGIIGDPFGENEEHLRSPVSGIVIGRIKLPLVHQGDALFHIANLDDADPLPASLEVNDLIPLAEETDPLSEDLT
jgi:predicted deacylase